MAQSQVAVYSVIVANLLIAFGYGKELYFGSLIVAILIPARIRRRRGGRAGRSLRRRDGGE